MLLNEVEDPKPMNAQEERELRRVFDHLAGYRRKGKIIKLISDKKDRLNQIDTSRKSENVVIIDGNGNRMTSEEIDKEHAKLVQDIEKHGTELTGLQGQSSKVIKNEDLFDAIKELGRVCTTKQISDMIWEADENLDNAVDWEELKAMFNRNLMDKTDLEPVNLFNVVQFMTYDKKLCGTITADDTMAIMFARYGRAQLESRMKNLFGDSDELSFVDYLERVSKRKKQSTGGKSSKGM